VPGLPAVVDDLVFRATRRDPNGRPADAGAFLTLVQSACEEIGLALANRAGPLAQPTVVVPRVTAERPAWARLPASQPTRRAPNHAPGGNWFRDLFQRINSHPRGRIGLAAALVALGLFAVVGGWWFGIGRYTAAPDLLNKTKAQAEAQAHQSGFAFKYGKAEYSENKAKDVVLRQNPGPGERIPSGGTITFTLSLGPERYAVPDVAGKDYEIAVNDLRQLRLQPDRSDLYDDLTPPNSVVRTDPPAGGMVPPGQHVLVYVSKGRAPVTVPAVVGRNIDEARGTLEHLGLQVVVDERDSSKPRGEVLSQDPADGSGVEKGTSVKLGVSKGPPDVAVPDYRGQPAQQAKAALEQAGFTVKIIGNENGTVIIQNPSGGTAPQGTEITLLAT
jgi:serine/threonine-protein kinase